MSIVDRSEWWPPSPQEWALKQAEMGRYTIKLYEYGEEGSPTEGSVLNVCGDISQALGYWQHVPDELMHRAAAFCLKDKPYGFTRGDVEDLHMMAGAHHPTCECSYCVGIHVRVRGLADRIEALLPPEEV